MIDHGRSHSINVFFVANVISFAARRVHFLRCRYFRWLALSVLTTDMYEVPDAVPPIHAVSSHVATDKDPSK